MEKPLSALREDLRRFGIERSDDVRESEDHMAALCETMATIIEHPDEIDHETQVAFFCQHLQPWARRFFEDVQSAKSAQFYASVGQLGLAFMEIENRYAAMKV